MSGGGKQKGTITRNGTELTNPGTRTTILVLKPAFRRLSNTRSSFSSSPLDSDVDVEEPFALPFGGGLDGPDPDSETISDNLNHDHVSWVPS